MGCMVKNSSTCKRRKQAKHLLLTCSHFWGSAEPKCSRQLLLKDPRIRFGRPEARVAVCPALREVGIESKILEWMKHQQKLSLASCWLERWWVYIWVVSLKSTSLIQLIAILYRTAFSTGPLRPTIPQDAYDSVGAGMSRVECHLKSLETQPLRQLQHGTSDLHPIWPRRHRSVAPAAVCNVRGQMPVADCKDWKAMIEQRWTFIECVVGVGSVEGQIRDFPIPRALVDVRG